MYLRQQLCAENDRNGNPRRVWVLYTSGPAWRGVVETRDEGYEGDPVHLTGTEWAESWQLPSIEVSVSEYRRFLNMNGMTWRRV